MKRFNTTAVCIPQKHYMVDISDKLLQIEEMIENEEYFTINRSRQFGKTTVLFFLERRLSDKYEIISTSFEGVGSDAFKSDKNFVWYFINSIARILKYTGIPSEIIEGWKSKEDYSDTDYEDAFEYLSEKITWLCENSEKEILLFIDEVDKASDNQIFLNFLGMLRNKYLKRQEEMDSSFKSVILVGVYDIKNLKLKIRPEEEKKYNSPWNIAADFNVDMSFHPEDIATMLQEYEADHHTEMDIEEICKELYFYTNGYPYLVSWLCKWIDEQGGKVWTKENIKNAEKQLHYADSTLIDDMIKNYENNMPLQKLIDDILFSGKQYSYVKTDEAISLGTMFGILCRKNDVLAISNIIFERFLMDHIAIKKDRQTSFLNTAKEFYIKDGKLDMQSVLLKFQEIMKAEYRQEDGKFLEQQGRLLFLCFLKPIINGTGFYYVEPETRNNTRMDLVVAYGSEEHIIELKLWHGEQYRKDGIAQLEGYLNSRSNDTGYLVSFSFNQKKEYTSGWLTEDETDRNIFEVVI